MKKNTTPDIYTVPFDFHKLQKRNQRSAILSIAGSGTGEWKGYFTAKTK